MCRVADRRLAIPAEAVEGVVDCEIHPVFPGCAAWLRGIARCDDGRAILVVRVLGGVASADLQAVARGRVAVIAARGGAAWGVEIDSVDGLSPAGDNLGAPGAAHGPAGWTRACTWADALLEAAEIQRQLDAGLAADGARHAR
jgi:hypothetical protein